MADPTLLPFAAAALIATGTTAAAVLRGWNEWLALRREQLSKGRGAGRAGGSGLAALRDRVRRLEAIANGADL
jgi:hypothetical protein